MTTRRRIEIEQLLGRLHGVREAGGGWRSQCPVAPTHELKVDLRQDGSVLLHCHGPGGQGGGCSTAAVVDALGVSLAELSGRSKGRQGPRQSREVRLARAGVPGRRD